MCVTKFVFLGSLAVSPAMSDAAGECAVEAGSALWSASFEGIGSDGERVCSSLVQEELQSGGASRESN